MPSRSRRRIRRRSMSRWRTPPLVCRAPAGPEAAQTCADAVNQAPPGGAGWLLPWNRC